MPDSHRGTYTISKLASEAGVSIHIVRDYVLRGLLHPVQHTSGGYRLFDERALARLRFVRTAFAAGIDLGEIAQLCHALDAGVGDISDYLTRLRSLVAERRKKLAILERQLARMKPGAPASPETDRHRA